MNNRKLGQLAMDVGMTLKNYQFIDLCFYILLQGLYESLSGAKGPIFLRGKNHPSELGTDLYPLDPASALRELLSYANVCG